MIADRLADASVAGVIVSAMRRGRRLTASDLAGTVWMGVCTQLPRLSVTCSVASGVLRSCGGERRWFCWSP